MNTRQILRRGTATATLGLIAAAVLAACEPRNPDPSDAEPVDGNPAPGAPPGAAADARDPRSPVAPPTALGQSSPGTPAASVVAPPADAHMAAQANLQPVGHGGARGVVEFFPNAQGGMTIQARLSGLPPGDHGLHIHEIGDCSSLDGAAAGEHLAPEKDEHGSPAAAHEAHHTGDLGNITAGDDGTAVLTINDDELTVNGDHGIAGRAVVVHTNKDDLVTQPSGNSGDPIACGVVEAAGQHAPGAN
jgi:Cu-Zn family superoxide dismutase